MDEPKHTDASELSYPEQFAKVAAILASRSEKTIRIFSIDLSADIYSNSDFVSAVSQMVRANRRAETRIIVMADALIASRTHHLVELCRQLPSLCKIRLLSEPPDKFKEDFLIGDRNEVLYRKAQHENLGWHDPENRAAARERIDHFDRLWNRAAETPEFRRLTI
ncbi:MAG: hypothetical protein AB8B86_09860 [Pseudomonadales bacterium]